MQHENTEKETERIGRIFSKIVDPKKVESILRDEVKREPLTQAHIEYVLAYVGGNPAEISERVGKVSDIATEHGAIVHDLCGPLVTIAYGTLRGIKSQPSQSRVLLVKELHRQLAEHVKIIHGEAQGYFGLIGSNKRMTYSFILPQFDVMLGALSRLSFGQTEEFQQ